MRKFNVMVNGEAFEVEIEEVGGNTVSAPAAPVPTAKTISETTKAAVPKVAPKQDAPKPVPSGAANEITSPLPGTVLSIIGKEGQAVNSGEVVMVIEAMKMENEIVAPDGGTLVGIHVKKGDSVQAGDLLFTLG